MSTNRPSFFLSKKQKVDFDERIRGTWLTLEASKNERRVEATSHKFSSWEPILWEERTAATNSNCTESDVEDDQGTDETREPLLDEVEG